MRIQMHDEHDLTLSAFDEPAFEVDADEGVHAHYSALQMFATSFGLCTFSVLAGYAEQLDVPLDGLEIRVRWSIAQGPNRIDHVRMEIRWPKVPEDRREAAQRAAGHCTLHGTLSHPPKVETVLVR